MALGTMKLMKFALFLWYTIGSAHAVYYFENYCSTEIDIGYGEGVIQSGTSSFNTLYANKLDCIVTLTTSSNRRISIDFESFNLEGVSISFLHCHDTLSVYDGSYATGATLNKDLCDYYYYNAYPSIESSGNSITFRLVTDYSISGDFEFNYASIPYEDDDDYDISIDFGYWIYWTVGGCLVGGILVISVISYVSYVLCCRVTPTRTTLVTTGGAQMQQTQSSTSNGVTTTVTREVKSAYGNGGQMQMQSGGGVMTMQSVPPPPSYFA